MRKLFSVYGIRGAHWMQIAETVEDAVKRHYDHRNLPKTELRKAVQETKEINPERAMKVLDKLIKDRESTLMMKMRELVELKQKRDEIWDITLPDNR